MDLYGRVIEVSIIDDRTADLGSNFAADDSEGTQCNVTIAVLPVISD